MLLDVKLQFDEALKSILPANTRNREEFVRFLLNHERKPVVVRNLCEQIMIAEKKLKLRMNAVKQKTLVFEMAKMFARSAIEHGMQQRLSTVERLRRVGEQSRIDEIKSAVKGLEDDVSPINQGHAGTPGEHS